MNYRKPEIRLVTKATIAVENHVQKGNFTPIENLDQYTTVPACEADE